MSGEAPNLNKAQQVFFNEVDKFLTDNVTNPMIFLYAAERFAKEFDTTNDFNELKKKIDDAWALASKYKNEADKLATKNHKLKQKNVILKKQLEESNELIKKLRIKRYEMI